MINLQTDLLDTITKKNYGSYSENLINNKNIEQKNNIISEIIDYLIISIIIFINCLLILSIFGNNNLFYLGIRLEIIIATNISLLYYIYQTSLLFNYKNKYEELMLKYNNSYEDFIGEYGKYLENLFKISINNKIIILSNLEKYPPLLISIILSLKYKNIPHLSYKIIILNSILIFLLINFICLIILLSSLYNIILGILLFLLFFVILIVINLYQGDKDFFYLINIIIQFFINVLFILITINT